MSAAQLCPSAKNELGKGIFAADEEAKLLAGGYIFARRVPGTLVGTLVRCKRPIADAANDMALDVLGPSGRIPTTA